MQHGILGLGGALVTVVQTLGVWCGERWEEPVQLLLLVERMRHYRQILACTPLRFLRLGVGGGGGGAGGSDGRAVGGIELFGVC